jgi:hypothetical protein
MQCRNTLDLLNSRMEKPIIFFTVGVKPSRPDGVHLGAGQLFDSMHMHACHEQCHCSK